MDPMLMLLVVFAVMMIPMFMMSSRQRKVQKQQQEMLRQLGVGDEVRTHSGFYGLIVEEYDDTVVLEAEDGSQLKWARAAIATKVDPADGVPVVGEDPASADARTAEDAEGRYDADLAAEEPTADFGQETSSAADSSYESSDADRTPRDSDRL